MCERARECSLLIWLCSLPNQVQSASFSHHPKELLLGSTLLKKKNSRGTPTGTLLQQRYPTRGTLLKKKNSRGTPTGTLLQQRYPTRGTLLKKKTSNFYHYIPLHNLLPVSQHHHDSRHYIFYPSSLLFLPLDVPALTPSSPNTYPRTYHIPYSRTYTHRGWVPRESTQEKIGCR